LDGKFPACCALHLLQQTLLFEDCFGFPKTGFMFSGKTFSNPFANIKLTEQHSTLTNERSAMIMQLILTL
jgi:hypothetical protein